MNIMNGILESLTGMDKLSDQVIATDFLISVKSGIRNYGIAITETTSKEVRTVLRKQLQEAITTHEIITNYMMSRGFYHAYDPVEQINLDLQTADSAINLTNTLM
jgi:similar to spore coat protein